MMIRNNPYQDETKGILTLVSTPIGNRDDITLRALNALKEADIIACEDTRNTSLLVSGYGIKNKKYVSLYAQTEARDAKALVEQIKKENLKVCYCSDAGMPGISDPGAILVKECYQQNVNVTILPGPSASLSALVLSSFDTADFSFFGFLPTKDGQIKKLLTPLKERQETLIFYESPKRIRHTLELVSEVFGPEREVAIVRELTKIHEETIASKVSEILSSSFEEKGEFVLIIKGSEERTIDQKEIDNRIKEGLKAGKSSSSLAKEIAVELSLSKNQIYDRILTLSKKLRG